MSPRWWRAVQDRLSIPDRADWAEPPQAPHCDERVLHAPGRCSFCDRHPDWQQLRKLWGIAFTGYAPGPGEMSCPSDFHRGLNGADVWPGNQARRRGWQ